MIMLVLFAYIQAIASEFDSWSAYCLQKWNCHTHTNISRTPWTNFQNINDFDHPFAVSPESTVKVARKLGIHLALSDHCLKMTLPEWAELLRVASEYSNNGFETWRGFEWTGYNHINVFNSQDYVAVFDVGAEGIKVCTDFDSFLDWLATQPDNVIAQFNHPSMSKHYFDFTKFSEHSAKDHFALFEVGSGPTGFYSHIKDNLPLYIQALQSGLSVSPTIGADNLGSPNKDMVKRHTVAWVGNSGFGEAAKKNRVYASEDADIQVKFQLRITKNNGQESIAIMGSKVEIDDSSKFCLEYDLDDPTDSQIGNVNVVVVRSESYDILPVANNQDVLRTISSNDFVFMELQDIICFFLYIVQADGDSIVTSPIWIKYQPNLIDQSERIIYCGVDSKLPVFRNFVKNPNEFNPKESKLQFLGPLDKQICIWLVVYNQPVGQTVSLKLHLICPESNIDTTHEEICIGKNNNFCLAFGICDIKDFAYKIHETNYLTIEFLVDDQLVESKTILIEVDNR
ncbi:MAG: hypothetical protein ACD_58C00149G0003 [uncultured bacterium]|nr:MAG: hypothetical protein ACD_58C00149G0003 [uncultured bacterium]